MKKLITLISVKGLTLEEAKVLVKKKLQERGLLSETKKEAMKQLKIKGGSKE